MARKVRVEKLARGVTLYCGDCLELLPTLAEASIDACVTDPPYGLSFMGKDWDSPGGLGDFPMRRGHPMNMVNTGITRQGGRQRSCEDFTKRQSRDMQAFQKWCEVWAREVFRVLRPGGHLLAFGGSRTYHRLACAIEDAGFEMRDQIMWIYGSGFPKSLDVSKATTFHGPTLSGTPLDDGKWQGFGTALKPAHEPIVLARKPLIGTVAENVLKHGVGALNIDGCRVQTAECDDYGRSNANASGTINAHNGFEGKSFNAGERKGNDYASTLGRWPANVIHDGSDEVVGTFPATGSMGHVPRSGGTKAIWSNGREIEKDCGSNNAFADSGSAARFFYSAKTSKRERRGSKHPTIKPLALMRYLVRLVTPPGGIVLDPFAGSGTTGEAARAEGVKAILIEQQREYRRDIQRRISKGRKVAA